MEVINKHKLGGKCRPTDVYIGRPAPLSNPYPITKETPRSIVIDKYKKYLKNRINSGDREIIYPLRLLRDNYRLVCFCKPKPCHGDIIKEVWEKEFKDKPLVIVFSTDSKGHHSTRIGRYAVSNACVCKGTTRLSNSGYGVPIVDRGGNYLDQVTIARELKLLYKEIERHPDIDYLMYMVDIDSRYLSMMQVVLPNMIVPDRLDSLLEKYRLYRYCRYYSEVRMYGRYRYRVCFDPEMKYNENSWIKLFSNQILQPGIMDIENSIVLYSNEIDNGNMVYRASRVYGYYTIDMGVNDTIDPGIVMLVNSNLFVTNNLESSYSNIAYDIGIPIQVV